MSALQARVDVESGMNELESRQHAKVVKRQYDDANDVDNVGQLTAQEREERAIDYKSITGWIYALNSADLRGADRTFIVTTSVNPKDSSDNSCSETKALLAWQSLHTCPPETQLKFVEGGVYEAGRYLLEADLTDAEAALTNTLLPPRQHCQGMIAAWMPEGSDEETVWSQIGTLGVSR
ncbi:hypothetical protein NEOLEDRAFT_1167283 [Neolentinus lepideus HHB14362 ss-1]|uniref:Uncharacterized protein n=1 Tax=Neolentinus lepideus HHB14362 ss-1 TaxID=1314782 RepID=A0A165UVN0_9AGAM|nr:hypothetical protein NEOLEDRAFT_1167283 [Neolentinus lepideus HHB14362 ss-1]